MQLHEINENLLNNTRFSEFLFFPSLLQNRIWRQSWKMFLRKSRWMVFWSSFDSDRHVLPQTKPANLQPGKVLTTWTVPRAWHTAVRVFISVRQQLMGITGSSCCGFKNRILKRSQLLAGLERTIYYHFENHKETDWTEHTHIWAQPDLLPNCITERWSVVSIRGGPVAKSATPGQRWLKENDAKLYLNQTTLRYTVTFIQGHKPGPYDSATLAVRSNWIKHLTGTQKLL